MHSHAPRSAGSAVMKRRRILLSGVRTLGFICAFVVARVICFLCFLLLLSLESNPQNSDLETLKGIVEFLIILDMVTIVTATLGLAVVVAGSRKAAWKLSLAQGMVSLACAGIAIYGCFTFKEYLAALSLILLAQVALALFFVSFSIISRMPSLKVADEEMPPW